MSLRRFKHNKTGNMYVMVAIAKDCTNTANGNVVAIYRRDEGHGVFSGWFVRDMDEFCEKFTEL